MSANISVSVPRSLRTVSLNCDCLTLYHRLSEEHRIFRRRVYGHVWENQRRCPNVLIPCDPAMWRSETVI